MTFIILIGLREGNRAGTLWRAALLGSGDTGERVFYRIGWGTAKELAADETDNQPQSQ